MSLRLVSMVAFRRSPARTMRPSALPRCQFGSKHVPDKAQLPVRARAFEDGKLLYMAVSMLADILAVLSARPEDAHPAPNRRGNEGDSSSPRPQGQCRCDAVNRPW
jgi:hypothetical protein